MNNGELVVDDRFMEKGLVEEGDLVVMFDVEVAVRGGGDNRGGVSFVHAW
ncbi:ABC transporter permease [Sesbania bispinosa]|nr:ABC transporter permease [Sesbania bispinosa]